MSAGRLTEQQQCGVVHLPAFGDRRRDSDSPPDDRFQAIVPAYTFNCTGRVAEWRACVQPGGRDERYYIQFQVWRPTGVPGCYTMVGYDAPPQPTFDDGTVENLDQLLQPDSGNDFCIVLPVREGKEIEFQPGDVVGYYADHFRRNGDDRDDGGVQVVSDQDVVVYHRINVPLSELKTQYAIPALGPHPSSCGFGGRESNLFQMTSSTSGAPIISLSLATTVVSNRIASNGIQTSTATIPSPTPTSVLTSTPPVPFGAHRSSSSSAANTTPASFSPCTSVGSDCSTCCSGGCAGSTTPPLNNDAVSIGVGVAVALLVLITAAVVIAATVLVYLWRRKRKLDLVDNVGTKEENMYSNMMYMAGGVHISTLPNQAYNITDYNKQACETPTSTDPVYQEVQCDGGSGIYEYPLPESLN